MQISQSEQWYGEIMPSTPESEEVFARALAKGDIIARGGKEHLLRLQGDLRKTGYRHQFNMGRLAP